VSQGCNNYDMAFGAFVAKGFSKEALIWPKNIISSKLSF
jgi:hypothetical protein